MKATRPLRALPLLLFAMIAADAGSRAQVLREALVRRLEPAIVVRPGEPRGDGILYERRVEGPAEAKYLRLHFSDITNGDAPVQVVIRGTGERVLARYGPETLGRRKDFLSDVLRSQGVTVQLQRTSSAGSIDGFGFTIDALVYGVDVAGRLQPSSILPSWIQIERAPANLQVTKYAESIAKLYMGDGAVCSGFLVGADLLLTNHHCIAHSTEFRASTGANNRPCADTKAHFDYDGLVAGRQPKSIACQVAVVFDPALDFALLRLAAELPARASPRVALKLADTFTLPVNDVFILHHPAGLPTQLSSACTASAAPAADEILHYCDTASGSSGAPLQVKTGEVIALHSDAAYPDNISVAELIERISNGETFGNRSKSAIALKTALKPYGVQ